MRIELPERLEAYVQHKIDVGLYSSGAEVLCDALRRMMEQDADATRALRFRDRPQPGVAQLAHGEGGGNVLANASPPSAQHAEQPDLPSTPLPPLEEDPELLALIARIKATPPNPASIIPAKGNLADVLRALESVEDPDYDLDAELAALDAAEAELRALDRANDIAEGRG